MTIAKFEVATIVPLLRRSENDPEVKTFFGQAISGIERKEYYGSLEFKPEGVDVVFNEAPWVLPSEEVTDPKELYVAAFHLHSEGHEGYAQYTLELPSGLVFGAPSSEVLQTLGQPLASGGGGMSSVLKRPVPRWFRYAFGNAVLHIQFDAEDRIDLVTIAAPDPKKD